MFFNHDREVQIDEALHPEIKQFSFSALVKLALVYLVDQVAEFAIAVCRLLGTLSSDFLILLDFEFGGLLLLKVVIIFLVFVVTVVFLLVEAVLDLLLELPPIVTFHQSFD